MKRSLVVGVCSLITLTLLLTAKGPTLKITIQGADLPAPVEIRDERLIQKFQVWSGVGTGPGIPNPFRSEQFIIDWEKGPVSAPPSGLSRYEVSFHVVHQKPSAYVVFWAYDRSTGQGYVYLPGKGEKYYDSNTFMILRGVEGNWFSATSAWMELAKPVVEQAKATPGGTR